MDDDIPHRIVIQPVFSGWIYFMCFVLVAYGLILSTGQATPVPKKESHTPIKLHMPLFHSSSPRVDKHQISPVNLQKTMQYQPIIFKAAHRYQVDPDLIKAIIMAESNYDPNAVSKRGALGLMQLMPRTAKSLGVEEPFDPEHNIDGGVRYFRQLLDKFDGNVTLALAAYNAGSRKVREYRGIPPYKQTERYIRNINNYYLYYKSLMTFSA